MQNQQLPKLSSELTTDHLWHFQKPACLPNLLSNFKLNLKCTQNKSIKHFTIMFCLEFKLLQYTDMQNQQYPKFGSELTTNHRWHFQKPASSLVPF